MCTRHSQAGPTKRTPTKSLRCYKSLPSIVSHERTSHSSDIDLIAELKKREKAMTNTRPRFVSSQRVVTQSPPTKCSEIVRFPAYAIRK